MTIYKKTAKGMNELMARRSSIDSHLNSMLLLVDGKRSESEVNRLGLLARMPADALEMLVHGGYIEALEDLDTATKTAPVQGAVSAQGKVRAFSDRPSAYPQELIGFADGAAEVEAFRALYISLVEKTRTLLGIRGLVYQLRLEQARTFGNLTALIAPLGDAVAKRHGLEAGMNFVRDCDIAVTLQLSSMRASQFSESEMGVTRMSVQPSLQM